MGWNNGAETKRFKKEEAEMIRICREEGVDEEVIKKIYIGDLNDFRRDRYFYSRVQSLDAGTEEDSEAELRSPLLDKYQDTVSCTDKPDENRPYWWMDEIENKRLYYALQRLTAQKREIIQLLIYEGRSRKEAAQILGISRTTLDKYFQDIVKNISEALK